MYAYERTQDIYEIISGYPKPPVIPLETTQQLYKKQAFGLSVKPFINRVVKALLAIAGFNKFISYLPDNIENLLRHINLRGPALFAPVVSAALAITDDPRHPTPADRATALVLAAYSLHKDIHSAQLPPDEYKGQILEMGQYPNLFSTNIIIENKKPRLYKTNSTSQIAVYYAEQIYIVTIDDPNAKEIEVRLRDTFNEIIKNQSNVKSDKLPASAGILTSASDRTQIRAFTVMHNNKINQASLEKLRHCFLTVCFDLDEKPASYSNSALKTQSSNFANRWNHTSIQIVIYNNSKTCLLCNFSTYIAGNTMVRAAAELQKRALQVTIPKETMPSGNPLPLLRLKWEIPQIFIQQAKKDIQSILDTQQAIFTIENTGRTFFESRSIRAIPVFIIALQMAVKQLTGEYSRISQFLSMSKFCCMDLATAMISTPEVLHFVDLFIYRKEDTEKLIPILKEAIVSQTREEHKARERISFSTMFPLFKYSIKGKRRIINSLLLKIIMLFLYKSGSLRTLRREIIVSHPAISPEVQVLGRPGVRIPYASKFGLHYQIFEEKIIISMMPGLKWNIPNIVLIKSVEDNIEKIKALFTAIQN